ncbi:hypothetical protein Hanom_Chr05g00440301 [Helianthus anomalus]
MWPISYNQSPPTRFSPPHTPGYHHHPQPPQNPNPPSQHPKAYPTRTRTHKPVYFSDPNKPQSSTC